jgi:TATA-binding protein-associated factor Taf7
MPQWVPNLRTHNRKKPPFEMPGHQKGCDYDCGDADQEMDPAIEGSFILRMSPGRDCDYLCNIMEHGECNTDSDVSLEFKAQRKAILKIRGRIYAAKRNSTSNCQTGLVAHKEKVQGA